jgi:hypothetical protein
MRTIRIVVTLGVLVAAHGGLGSAPAAAGEEGTVEAMATWQGRGRFFQTSVDEALFVGAFAGILYVQTQAGELDAAKMACPFTMTLNLNDGEQSAEGRCFITARGGDRVFAKWACAGKSLKGCAGKFVLTGGTGKFLGIGGESDFLVRSSLAELTVQGDGSVEETAAGLAAWPALKYRIP